MSVNDLPRYGELDNEVIFDLDREKPVVSGTKLIVLRMDEMRWCWSPPRKDNLQAIIAGAAEILGVSRRRFYDLLHKDGFKPRDRDSGRSSPRNRRA